MNMNNEEVEVFNKETVKDLLKEGYTQKEINEAKAQTERLMRKMDLLELQELKQHNNPNGSLTFKEAYDMIDHNRLYSDSEASELKRKCLNEYEGDVIYRLIYFDRYRHQQRSSDNINVVFGLNYLKSLIDNYKKFNSFDLSEECVEKMKDEIKYWSTPKNESKKIRIKIKTTMPEKRLEKYGLEPGNIFASQKDLAEFCGVTIQMIRKWKKSNYIEEIVERPLSQKEIEAMLSKI